MLSTDYSNGRSSNVVFDVTTEDVINELAFLESDSFVTFEKNCSKKKM